MHQQLEIKFFFPFTEQIPLGLNLSECDEYVEKLKKERLQSRYGITSNDSIGLYTLNNSNSSITPIWQNPIGDITIDVDNIIFKVKKKPNVFKRGIYKLIGLKWRVK
jgi:hypothetical protein